MNIFKFDDFLVPKILKLIYTISVFIALAVGLYTIFTGISDGIEMDDLQGQIPTIIKGFGIGILVPLIFRISTELVLLLFQIEENTRKKKS